jgi:pimeloyl-ACP methyl ester carboxylesterase
MGFWSAVLLSQLLVVVIAPIALVVTAVMDLAMTIRHAKRILRFFPSEQQIQTLENHVYQKYCTGAIHSHWKELTVMMGGLEHMTEAHFVHVPCTKHLAATPNHAPNILLIHGNAATGACFVECLEPLSHKFNVYVLDLPGYGRTVASFHPTTPEDTIQYYSSFIEAFAQSQSLDQVFVLGHSYGGFLTVHWACKYPGRATQLCLLDAAGVCPTLGPNGAYWAFIFKKTLLQTGRKLGKVGAWCAFNLFTAWGCSAEVFYWYAVLAHPAGWGGSRLAPFITLQWTRAWWNAAALPSLIQVCVPVLLVYGENDDIIPPRQGEVLQKAIGCDFRVVPRAGHSPFHGHDAQVLSSILITWFNQNALQTSGTVPPASIGQATQTLNHESFQSSFSTSHTKAQIQHLYNRLEKTAKNGKRESLDGV